MLETTDRGLYCKAGDFYIDPWKPVEKAVITHAHADHARSGHKNYLAHAFSIPVMKHRLGNKANFQSLDYIEVIKINDVSVSLHPAGHIPGSAQIRLVHKGKVSVVSGDYKLVNDGIATPYEPLRCHTYISECTFGLPVYKWPSIESVTAEINDWWRENTAIGKNSIIYAYSLGKAQRIIDSLDMSIGPVFCHSAIYNMNHIYRKMGIELDEIPKFNTKVGKTDKEGILFIAPPAAQNSRLVNKLRPFSDAFASGWMLLRGSRRRRAVDRGFVLSDHGDWDELNEAINNTEAEEVWLTHGYSEIFSQWLKGKGINAKPLDTMFDPEYEEENIENSGE